MIPRDFSWSISAYISVVAAFVLFGYLCDDGISGVSEAIRYIAAGCVDHLAANDV